MMIEFFFFCFSFLRAMSSPSNKEQFLNQFESIVKGIVDNKSRVSFAEHLHRLVVDPVGSTKI